MSDRLFICIPCFNRRKVVEQCLPTVIASKYAGDEVRCYNDGSTKYGVGFLRALGADWAGNYENMGVDAQRRMHILDFMEAEGFSHAYFTDSDALHDPHWRGRLLEIQNETGLLTCGYHTATHENYKNNVYARKGGIVFTRFAPGVSYLLTRKHVEKIAAHLPERWSWDWAVPSLLGYQCAVSDVSCVDHIGVGGTHVDDVALNPTDWLVKKRAEVMSCLKS